MHSVNCLILVVVPLLAAAAIVNAAPDATDPRRHSPTQCVGSEDHAVLQVVLRDVLFNKPRLFRRSVGPNPLIILDSNSLTQPPITNEDHFCINLERMEQVPSDLYRQMREQNQAEYDWSDFRPASDCVLLLNLRQFELASWRRDTGRPQLFWLYPDARAWIRASRPAYSADGMSALISLSLGPAPHGARSMYLLKRNGDAWQVAWSELLFGT